MNDRFPVHAADVTPFQSSTSTDTLRPEVIERGRRLANDDSYPPFAICQEVASAWIESVPQEDLEIAGAR